MVVAIYRVFELSLNLMSTMPCLVCSSIKKADDALGHNGHAVETSDGLVSLIPQWIPMLSGCVDVAMLQMDKMVETALPEDLESME